MTQNKFKCYGVEIEFLSEPEFTGTRYLKIGCDKEEKNFFKIFFTKKDGDIGKFDEPIEIREQ